METRASYLLVGLFVLIFSLGLLGFILWLGKFQTETSLETYDIIFQSSVTGLKEGSPVRFSGVRVGEVLTISLDADRPGDVRVTIEVAKENSPVRADTSASLELEGLTGGRYVLLHPGKADSERPEPTPDGGNPVLASRASTFELVLEGAPKVLESANILLARANNLLNEENRENIAQVLRNLDEITSSFVAHRTEIETLVKDTAVTMRNLREASASLDEMAVELRKDGKALTTQAGSTLSAIEDFTNTGKAVVGEVAAEATQALNALETLAGNADQTVRGLAGETKTVLATLDEAGQQLDDTLREIEALVAENREPIRDFSATGLYEFSALVTEARGLVRELSQITSELQRDPARFLFGDRQQGYETE